MDAVIQLFRNMGTAKLVALIGTLLAVITMFTFILLKYNQTELIVLYSNLEIEDSNKIVAELEQKRIKHEIRANGTQILVEADKVLRLRMELAQEGIPGKGSIVGYEIFDNSDSINTSNFVQNIHLQRALEGELGRTISSFEQIKKARVHLVIPKRELFAKENQQPSASVVLEMSGSKSLSKEEVQAITHLVSSAVPSLDPKKVTIVDTRGKSLKLSEDSDDSAISASNTQEYRMNFENKLKKTIESLLEKTIGAGGVEAQVSAEMNFDKTVINSEIYDPEGQVVRSTQTIQENEYANEGGSGGDTSVNNNIPNNEAALDQGSNSNRTEKVDETVNFEISKTIKNHISETGVIKKLSIAVLIDGKYSKNPNSGEQIYTPRSDEEIEQIKKLVTSAVGFNAERGDKLEVINLKFKEFEEEKFEKESLVDVVKSQLKERLFIIIQYVITGILVLLFILLFVKPFVFKVFDSATASIQAQIDAEVAIAQAEVEQANIKTQAERESRVVYEEEDESDIIHIQKNKTFKSVNDIAEQCPQETIMIIRNWLNN